MPSKMDRKQNYMKRHHFRTLGSKKNLIVFSKEKKPKSHVKDQESEWLSNFNKNTESGAIP